MSNHRVLAEDILRLIGGPSNVEGFTFCMTRLRVSIIDPGKIEEARLKATKGVLGIVKDDTYQIILGPGTVTKVAAEFGGLLEAQQQQPAGSSGKPTHDTVQAGQDIKAQLKKKNNTPFKNFLRKIGSIFIPLIPALVGAGIINGIAGLMANVITSGNKMAWLLTLQPIVSVIGAAFFGFLTIFAGMNAAKEFGGTPALGGAVASIIIAPAITKISYTIPVFGLIKLNVGQGGIIGAVLAAIFIAYLEQYFRKRIPSAIDVIVTPTISLLIAGLVTIFLLMPLSGIISAAIGTFTTWMLQMGGPIAGYILAALFLPLVMFGLHQALIPIHAELINQVGYTALLPILAMAGAGQVGAAIAIYVRLRNKQMREVIKGALPVGFLGIGEPLIYGVSLPLGRPFVTACLGGGFGGAVLGIFAAAQHFVGTVAIGPSGLVLLPLLSGPMGLGKTVLAYLGGLITAYIAGFVLTYFFGITKQIQEEYNS